MRPPRLVLASGSPRRREILSNLLGLEITVRPAEVDETPRAGEDPAAYVARLAREKAHGSAEAVAGSENRPAELILAADTVVVLGGEILGKPADAEDARAMLRSLADRDHEVLTGVGALLVDPEASEPRFEGEVARTRVRFAPLAEEDIAWYVETGEPMDKAGAYGIQGLGALFVESIEGNYGTVVGLPVPTTARLTAALGHPLRSFRKRVPDDEPGKPAAPGDFLLTHA